MAEGFFEVKNYEVREGKSGARRSIGFVDRLKSEAV